MARLAFIAAKTKIGLVERACAVGYHPIVGLEFQTEAFVNEKAIDSNERGARAHSLESRQGRLTGPGSEK